MESSDQHHKMDRRKKRTSTNQYMMYLDMMEKDSIFATGRIPRDVESNYLHKKWKELSDKLNTCSSGPTLTAEEWRKRLNDWKNTTRCKYRRSVSGEKDISLTSLELKALDLFGKVPSTGNDPISITLKSEKEDPDDEVEHQRTSESLQKELQAAVEEAICGDDDDDAIQDENEEQEDIITHTISNNVQTSVSTNTGAANVGTSTTYRTIVVENTAFTDDDQNQDHLEFITQRRHTLGPSSTSSNVVATGVQTAAPPTQTTVTKLINGEMPLKRLRTQPPTEQVIYEVKKAPVSHPQPRTITIHNTGVSHAECNTIPSGGHNTSAQLMGINNVPTHDAREIARQLKRIADIKAEKLKFEIARFKFNNPGFVYHSSTL